VRLVPTMTSKACRSPEPHQASTDGLQGPPRKPGLLQRTLPQQDALPTTKCSLRLYVRIAPKCSTAGPYKEHHKAAWTNRLARTNSTNMQPAVVRTNSKKKQHMLFGTNSTKKLHRLVRTNTTQMLPGLERTNGLLSHPLAP
jgi:hypothetical protein